MQFSNLTFLAPTFLPLHAIEHTIESTNQQQQNKANRFPRSAQTLSTGNSFASTNTNSPSQPRKYQQTVLCGGTATSAGRRQAVDLPIAMSNTMP